MTEAEWLRVVIRSRSFRALGEEPPNGRGGVCMRMLTSGASLCSAITT